MSPATEKTMQAENPIITSETRQQAARANLRQRYLRMLSTLSMKNCPMQVTFNDKKIVPSKFEGADKDGVNFVVSDLETPIGTLPHALLRSEDVRYMEFKNVCSYNFVVSATETKTAEEDVDTETDSEHVDNKV